MTGQDAVYAAFAAAYPDAHVIVVGRPGARYLVGIEKSLIVFMVDGEPDTNDFLEIFARALSSQHMASAAAVLIDLIRFTGAVDWGAVTTLHGSIDCKAIGLRKIAYLVRDAQFAPLAKIAGAIFAEAEHVVFSDRSTALAWLATPG